MDGRFYGGRKLEAEIYDGRIRYKTKKQAGLVSSLKNDGSTKPAISGTGTSATETENIHNEEEDDEDKNEERRLDEFGKWLENQG